MKKNTEIRKLKITVMGMGYIGLPTAIVFAEAGFKVYGYDINHEVIQKLERGEIHFVEPGLEKVFEKVLKAGYLIPTGELKRSDIFIICVPTPLKELNDEKAADLSYVISATHMISALLEKGNLVILESTVPPGTTEEVVSKILENKTGLKANKDFYVAHCPERVLPGNIIYELKNNDRIVGVSNEYAGNLVKTLYETFLERGKVYITDTKIAELCKLVENAYRDVNIAFANEVSMIAEKMGIDPFKLIELANKHPRVNILKPGVGVGGHCLPIDPWFIVEKLSEETLLIRTARKVNELKTLKVIEKIEEALNYDKSKSVGILGLSYKPNTDDIRESPSLKIAKTLMKKGYIVFAHEPYIMKEEIEGIKNVSLDEIIQKTDLLVLTVAHDTFLENKSILKTANLIDFTGSLR